jgi:predicted nucleic acid-binding protein
MQRMHRTVISDASCLILLANIGELELLKKVYTQIITTKEVATEYGFPLPDWIEIQSPHNLQRQKTLEQQIDLGEASAIALAVELNNSLIILDDNRARKIAEQLGLTVTGTIGVLITAKRKGIIASVAIYLEKLKNAGLYLSKTLEEIALKEAGEGK